MTAEVHPSNHRFIAAVGDIAASMGWRLRSFERDGELVALTALDHDPSFEQIIWIYDPKRAFVRCLLLGRGTVPAEREAAIIELCARINDGLVFGCAEYSFADRTLLFREAILTSYGDLKSILTDVSARVLNLGSRYWPAIGAALAGKSAADAMTHVRDSAGERGQRTN